MAPGRFYFYYMFALEWDKSLLPPAPQPQLQEEQDAVPGAANGRVHQPPPDYDQKSVNLTADSAQSVRPPLALVFPACAPSASMGTAD